MTIARYRRGSRVLGLAVLAVASTLATGAERAEAQGTAPGIYIYVSCRTVLDGMPQQPDLSDCQREGSAERELRDVEFLNSEYLATWVEPAKGAFGEEGGGFVFVAPVDPVTGSIRINFADQLPLTLPRLSDYGNGPEWGESRRGPEVFVTCQDTEVDSPALCRAARSEDGTWGLTQLPDSLGYQAKDPSRSPRTAVPMVHYEILNRAGPKIYGWRPDIDDPVDIAIPTGLASGRWTSDGRRLLLTQFGIGAGRSIVALDAKSGTVVPLFDDDVDRSFPFPWAAPELGGAEAFVVRTDAPEGFSEGIGIAVYRPKPNREPDDARYELWTEIPPICPDYPYTSSPEPFVVGDTSYLAMVSYTDGDKLEDPGVIWIASVDPDLPPERQVRRLISPTTCNADRINRRDPEALALEDGESARLYFVVSELD